MTGVTSIVAAPAGTRPGAVSRRAVERASLFILTTSAFLALVEPSPYEFVFSIVVIVFMASGGLRLAPSVLPLVFCVLGFGIGGFISLAPYLDEIDSVMFTLISAYMCVTTIFYAMLPRVDAEGRLEALRKGYVLAAVLASIAGIIGYFNIAGLGEIFTRYDRAAGTFKDPNVLGTFVILPLVHLVRQLFVDRIKVLNLAAIALILFGGVFLSFSRGAWIHAIASLALMTILTYRASRSGKVRRRIIAISVAGVATVAAALPVALSFDAISSIFETRASLEQSYDLGEQGRFGNQIASLPLLIERPNGFGPHRFVQYFPEDPHDVFLNAFASYGWLGGFSYLVLIIMTVAIGWRIVNADFPLRGHAIAIWSTLFIQILQGFQIDTDHWRHFWLMLGLIWGMLPMLQSPRPSEAPARTLPSA